MRRFVTTADLVEATGYSRESLWRLRRAGLLAHGVHYVRIGRRLFWHLENFERWRTAFEAARDEREER